MDLKKCSKKDLERIFLDAKPVKYSDMQGEYAVDMLTGPLPNLCRFSHRKLFYSDKDRVLGYNLFFSKSRWGYFFLEKATFNNLEVMVINYNREENNASKNIRDQIRCVDRKKGIYLGRFNYVFGKKLKFLGYFSLKSIAK